MAKVVTFGEVMMRLSCKEQGRFMQAGEFDVCYAGSEANVASALAHWGIDSAYVTCLPDNDLGRAAISSLHAYGVKTDSIVLHNGRLGLYFLEHGASLRSPKIIYDRFDSVFEKLDPGDFNWQQILNGADWFHWSGITPAISATAAQACLDAVSAACAMGITVSGDINYRRNLWRYGKSAREVMPDLVAHTHIVVAGVTDFSNCLGIERDSFQSTCDEVVKHYPRIREITTTNRETLSASHNRLSGLLWTGKKILSTKSYDLFPIVDRVGAGDAFMAGYIYASLDNRSDQEIIDFATASGALKHAVEGDVNVVSVKEIQSIINGDNIGRLLR